MSLEHVSNSILSKIDVLGLNNAYIVNNKYLEKLLFNRGLVGKSFIEVCFNASVLFFKHFKDEFIYHDNISELMLLSKGYYYQFVNSYIQATGNNLQLNMVATKRKKIVRNNVEIEIPYSDISALTDTIIIGDTIASGASICAAISHYSKRHKLKKAYIFSYAGSIVGGKRIASFCSQYDIDLTLVYGLAAFGLADNGFDLSFLHPDTITSEEYILKAKNVYKNKAISVIGVDFGTQSQSIKKYSNLCWLERQYWDSDDDVFPVYDSNVDSDLLSKEISAFNCK